MTTKRCSKCGKTKELVEFYRARGRPDGKDRYCAPCRRAMVRKYRAARGRTSTRGSPWKDHPGEVAEDRARAEQRRVDDEARDLEVAAILRAQREEILGLRPAGPGGENDDDRRT